MGHKIKSILPTKFKRGFLDKLDKRTEVTKDLLARFEELTDDLGGAETLSYQQRSLCERALWLEYFVGESERSLADGGTLDISKHSQAVAMLGSLYNKLGLKRVEKLRTISDVLKEKSK